MTEMIGLLVLQDNIPQEGLKELDFNAWGQHGERHLVEPFDDSLMQ